MLTVVKLQVVSAQFFCNNNLFILEAITFWKRQAIQEAL